MTDSGPQHQALIDLLETLRTVGGFDFTYTLQAANGTANTGAPPTQPHTDDQGDASPASPTTLEVVLDGPDVPLLLDRGGELLHAIESLAAAVLRLTPEQNEQLSFDAGNFKAERAASIAASAEQAIAQVRSSGEPFVFPPMNARERRMLHMALASSGLSTASSGDGARRFVVLYPEGHTPEPERFAPAAPPRRNPGSNRPGNWQGQNRGPRRPGQRDSRAGDRPDPRGAGRRPSPGGSRPQTAPSGNQPGNQPDDSLPGERRSRPALDPNGNPIENPALPDTREPGNSGAAPAPGSVEERLAKLRQNFRSR